jgi:hypothetical protein
MAATPHGKLETMPSVTFRTEEREALLRARGIGPVILSRLEAAGLGSFERLLEVGAAGAAGMVCAQQGSPSWMNRQRALMRALEAAGVACRRTPGQP